MSHVLSRQILTDHDLSDPLALAATATPPGAR
jgi:hypothetical protein